MRSRTTAAPPPLLFAENPTDEARSRDVAAIAKGGIWM
jgi:hypothetical protein